MILHPRQWVWGRGVMGDWSWECNGKHWVHGNRSLRSYPEGYVKDSDLAQGRKCGGSDICWRLRGTRMKSIDTSQKGMIPGENQRKEWGRNTMSSGKVAVEGSEWECWSWCHDESLNLVKVWWKVIGWNEQRRMPTILLVVMPQRIASKSTTR